jgi:hypothetical protein
MRTRTYALAMSAIGCGLFVAVAAANVIIDPQKVFGTGYWSLSPNENDRYQKLLAYQRAPARYDGLFFGSSRAFVMPLDDLSRSMDGVSFASFAVVGGMVVDHLATLEFILRDKAARGERLRAVFLLIDADLMGRRPFTNETNQFLMPPALSGEHPARFWWKNLVTIQFKAWGSALRAGRKPDPGVRRDSSATRMLQNMSGAGVLSAANAQPLPGTTTPAAPQRERVTHRADYLRQLKLFERLVALCRAHDIRIAVATSPLSAQGAASYDLVDLAVAIDDVGRIVPIWDFSNSDPVLNNSDVWDDWAHFRPVVAQMMLRRMFGAEVPSAWASFGRRLPP